MKNEVVFTNFVDFINLEVNVVVNDEEVLYENELDYIH